MDLMDTLKKTGKTVEDMIAPSNKNDMDILDKLKMEHREVADLLDQLNESESSSTRKSLLKKIKAALVPHVRAEEKIVYNAIISKKDVHAKVDGEEGYCEHHLVDKLLVDLSKISNAASPEFSAGAKVLKEIITHHVDEEERNVWRDIRKYYDADGRKEMNREFEAAKKKVRLAA